MRSSVQKVSNALKDSNRGRSSLTSMNSAVSILQNVTNEPSEKAKKHKVSIMKSHKAKRM